MELYGQNSFKGSLAVRRAVSFWGSPPKDWRGMTQPSQPPEAMIGSPGASRVVCYQAILCEWTATLRKAKIDGLRRLCQRHAQE